MNELVIEDALNKAVTIMKATSTEIKTHFGHYLDVVQKGEEVIIAKAGKPVAKLVAYTKPLKRRQPGLWKGQVWISDDFTKEDPEINKLFEGE